jgi:hypothetical protein
MLREFYPELTEYELIETERQLRQYFEIAKDLSERLQADFELRQKYEQLKKEYELLTGIKEEDSLNTVES